VSNTHLHNDVFYPHRTNIISELVNGKRVPGPIWRKREYRLKFLLRSLLFWSSTHRMLEALSGRDDFDSCWPLKLHCRANPPTVSDARPDG
jgi:uncharacterized protein VirK/YbjX